VSSAPRHTSDDETVRYVATESEEQARVEYPTLPPPNFYDEVSPNFYDEVGDHSRARVDQDDSNPGPQTGVDTPVYETAPDGIQLQDSSPEWTANPNLVPPTAEYCTLQTAADDQEPHTVSQQFPTPIVDTVPGGNEPHNPPPEWTANPNLRATNCRVLYTADCCGWSNYELPIRNHTLLVSSFLHQLLTRFQVVMNHTIPHQSGPPILGSITHCRVLLITVNHSLRGTVHYSMLVNMRSNFLARKFHLSILLL
jgi:hypothetical protein